MIGSLPLERRSSVLIQCSPDLRRLFVWSVTRSAATPTMSSWAGPRSLLWRSGSASLPSSSTEVIYTRLFSTRPSSSALFFALT